MSAAIRYALPPDPDDHVAIMADLRRLRLNLPEHAASAYDCPAHRVYPSNFTAAAPQEVSPSSLRDTQIYIVLRVPLCGDRRVDFERRAQKLYESLSPLIDEDTSYAIHVEMGTLTYTYPEG